MKIREIIVEAHHSIYTTRKIGPWTVDIDSHLMASIADRSDKVDMRDVTNIINYACMMVSDLDKIIPGRGAFVKDTNTNIAVFVHRYKEEPDRLRFETVLTPEMKTRGFVITLNIPPHEIPRNPKSERNIANMRTATQSQGRDAVSQGIEKMTMIRNSMVGLSRSERREFMRRMEADARRVSKQNAAKRAIPKA